MAVTNPPSDSLDRLRAAVGRRHGIVLAPTLVPRIPADPSNLFHASVVWEDDPNGSAAGGGVGFEPDQAEAAALAEALERYAASVTALPTAHWDDVAPTSRLGLDAFSLHTPEQQQHPALANAGYRPDPELVEVWRLDDNEPVHVPASLVGLTDYHGRLSTSSGLAASFSVEHALLRAVEELIERDAFMATWLHSLPGREIDRAPVSESGETGWLRTFDLTQAWSPHAVIGVVGSMPLAGRPRNSFGVACRADWRDAATKAEQECIQGTTFAGYEVATKPEVVDLEPDGVTDFDKHAVYYTARPEGFTQLPLVRGATPWDPPPAVEGSLSSLVATLKAAGIDLFYRELTTIDLHQIGLRVVRVLSPQLTPIHHDHRLPFLGGTTPSRAWRYPDLEPVGPFPSPDPHPLG